MKINSSINTGSIRTGGTCLARFRGMMQNQQLRGSHIIRDLINQACVVPWSFVRSTNKAQAGSDTANSSYVMMRII